MFNWRFWIWFVIILGWTLVYYMRRCNLTSLDYFVSLAVITVIYIVTIVLYIYTQKIIPLKKIGKGFGIIVASIAYYTLFRFSNIYLKLSIFSEKDLLKGFAIGIFIGLLYIIKAARIIYIF